MTNPREIWCNGASFDFPMLDAAFRAMGGKVPWEYWQQRDVRTMWYAAFPDSKPEESATHDAGEDCYRQIRMLREARGEIIRLCQGKEVA